LENFAVLAQLKRVSLADFPRWFTIVHQTQMIIGASAGCFRN